MIKLFLRGVKMKKYCLLLVFAFIITGCKRNDLYITDIKEKAELDYVFKIDSLKGLVKKSSQIDKVLAYRNNLILFNYRYKTAYICDLKFNIIKKYELAKDYEKILNGKISDVFVLRDTLFVGDDTYIIKKLDLTTGKVKSIPLKINLFQNFPFTLFIKPDGGIITSFRCMFNNSKDKVKWDYVWGSVFDPNGKQTEALGSFKDEFDYDLAGLDQAYYNEFENNKYVCFGYSKNVIQLAPVEMKFSLYVNKGWTKPHYGPQKTLSAFTMNYQKLIKYKNYFLLPALPEKAGEPAKIILYNSEFTPVKILELKNVLESYWYNITVVGDNMVVYNRNSAADPFYYVFDLTKLSL